MASRGLILTLIFFCASISYSVNPVEGYEILMICPAPSKSHQILCNGIVSTLAENKHQVTYITSFQSKIKNIREINIRFDRVLSELSDNAFEMAEKSTLSLLSKFTKYQVEMVDLLFTDENAKKILNDKSQKFDLIFYEYLMNDMMTGFGVRYDCPVMLLSVDLVPWVATMTSNPLSLATVPMPMLTSFSKSMTLYERTLNTIGYILNEILGKYFIEWGQKELYEKYMPEEAKLVPFKELKNKIAMVVINSHPSYDVARPLLPNVAQISGYHIGEPEPLPKDLQEILDSAEHGVIYFSMGSILKSSKMKPEIKQAILKTLSSLKETVLWKFEEDLPEKSKNVIIKNWMPQWSILAHPNVKLFISHGGLLSTLEAINFGVPMLAIPIFGDQPQNAKKMAERSQGVVLPYESINEDNFTRSINEVIGNPIYAQSAKDLKNLFHDRPMKPRDLLAFSVNHVIKTKGAKHLSPPPLCRCSQMLLDVAAVIMIPIGIIVFLSLYTCKKVCLRRKNSNKTKKD